MRRDKSLLYARIAMAILFSCLFICSNSYYYEFESKGVGLFSGLFHVTVTTHIFHLFIIVITCLVLQLSGFFPRKLWTNKYSSIKDILFMKIVYYTSTLFNKTSDQYKIIEYPLIILFVVIGGTFLISSSDMISIFLSIELQSYGLYILCAIYRNSERATGGALVYFLLGGLSSCFILLAFGLLYSNCGNTSFDNIYIINNINNVTGDLPSKLQMTFDSLYESSYLHLSLIIMSVGFLFKVSAAPFHFWSPDVYDSIPTLVTTFVAVFAKISIFVMLLELVHYTTNIYQETNNLSSDFSWTFTLLISSILSLIIGAVLGLTQFRIKRLYAYSTISHIGFILLALTINTIESVQSFIFYLMQYSLTNLNAFIILVSIGYSLYLYVKNKDDKITEDSEKNSDDKLLDKNNSPIQLVDQVKGLFYINPTLSLSLAITLFSFVGIPPLVGFFAKQMVLSSALDNGYVFITLIAILSSVISAYYYLAVVKQMFFYKASFGTNPELEKANYKINIINRFGQSNDNIELGLSNMQLSGSLSITISSLSLVILLFILNPQEWLNMASILALIMFNC